MCSAGGALCVPLWQRGIEEDFPLLRLPSVLISPLPSGERGRVRGRIRTSGEKNVRGLTAAKRLLKEDDRDFAVSLL